MKTITKMTMGVAALALCQCAPPAKTIPPQQAFDVNVAIAPAAMTRLQELGDNVVVDVYYYGFPKPGAKAPVDDIGRVRLGDELYEIKLTATRVTVTPTELDPDLFSQVIEPRAQITVYSRTAQNSADDVLECTMFNGTFANTAKAVPTITCALPTTPN